MNGRGALPWVAAGVVAAALVAVVVAAAIVGIDVGGPNDASRSVEIARSAGSTVAETEPVASSTVPSTTVTTTPERSTVVILLEPTDGLVRIGETLDRLEDGHVVRFHATGGLEGFTGEVRQCEREGARQVRCSNRFPVQFDDIGSAWFQYQLVDRDSCGALSSCNVVIDGGDGVGLVATIFGDDAPPPPSVRVHPDGSLEPGQTVDVTVSGIPTGSDVVVSYCRRLVCGPPVTATGSADGTAHLRVKVGDRCSRCGVVVQAAGGSEVFEPVRFTEPPAVGYDRARLVLGLLVAAVLLLLAAAIVRANDWRPPSEAATPEFDDVEPFGLDPFADSGTVAT